MATKKLEGAQQSGVRYGFKGEEIRKLKVSSNLVRFEEVDQAYVLDLARRINKEGQKVPVIVRIGSDGLPELVAGRHRQAAILLVNDNLVEFEREIPLELNAILHQCSEEEALDISWAENTGKPPTCMDRAKTAVTYSRMGHDNSTIAQKMSTDWHKVSVGRVGELINFHNLLPHSIQLMLHRGTLKEATARALLRLKVGSEELQGLADQIVKGELKPAEITRQANEQRRSKGKVIRRNIGEIRIALENVGTDRALNFLAWLDGQVTTDEVLEQIFSDEVGDGEGIGRLIDVGDDEDFDALEDGLGEDGDGEGGGY